MRQYMPWPYVTIKHSTSKTHDVEQGPSNYSPQDKSCQPPTWVNKIPLEHSYFQLFKVSLMAACVLKWGVSMKTMSSTKPNSLLPIPSQ